VCLFLSLKAAATTSENQTVVLSYRTEATPSSDVDFWAVYSTVPEDKTEEGDFPCCLMVKMKMEIIIGDQVLDLVPDWAVNANDTCSTYGEGEQELRLSWNSTLSSTSLMTNISSGGGSNNETGDDDDYESGEDEEISMISHLTMTFKKDIDTDPKIPYTESDMWVWTSDIDFETPNYRVKINNVNLFQAPWLFAFTCKGQSIFVPAVAERLGRGDGPSSDASSVFEDKDRVNVTLIFHHLEVEPFRNHRYYAEFTHLKWDCHLGWPYSHIPVIVNLVLCAFTIFMAGSFYSRHRDWKRRTSLIIPSVVHLDANDNLSLYQADDEQQLLSTSSDDL